MKTITKILLIAFFLRLILSFVTWHPDLNNHVDWGIRFWQYGPEKFYKANVWSWTWPNQPPGTIYIFAAMRKLFELVFAFFWFLNIKIPLFPSNVMLFFESNLYQAILKLPSVLADIGLAYLIYRIFKNQKKAKLGIYGATLFLVNPVTWYNSTIWGQTDSIVNFFGLLAFVLLLEKKLTWAVFAMLLTLYIKLSLLIFLPAFIVILVRQKYKLNTILKSVVIPILVIIALTLPFSQGNPIEWLFRIYKDKILTQQLQVITANAFNLWAALTGIHEQKHTLMFGPLSYKTWGEILGIIAIIPAHILIYRKQDVKSVVWGLAIISSSYFMLATNMHERYLYPLFPYLTILVIYYRLLIPLYAIMSLIHLINLYHFWWYPRIELLVSLLSLGNRLPPRLLGLGNFIAFLWFYKKFLKINFSDKNA